MNLYTYCAREQSIEWYSFKGDTNIVVDGGGVMHTCGVAGESTEFVL